MNPLRGLELAAIEVDVGLSDERVAGAVFEQSCSLVEGHCFVELAVGLFELSEGLERVTPDHGILVNGEILEPPLSLVCPGAEEINLAAEEVGPRRSGVSCDPLLKLCNKLIAEILRDVGVMHVARRPPNGE